MKKFVSLVLALAICLSCGVFAFAADNTYEDVEEVVVTEVTPRYREEVEAVRTTTVWKYLPYSKNENVPLSLLKTGERGNVLNVAKDVYGNYWIYVSVIVNGASWHGYVSSNDVKYVIGE